MQIRTLALSLAFGALAWTGMAQAQAPAGATAQCKDGTYYDGASRRGACARHGGIQTWLADEKAAPKDQGVPRPATVTPAPAAGKATVTNPAAATTPPTTPTTVTRPAVQATPATPPSTATRAAPQAAPATTPGSAPATAPAAASGKRSPPQPAAQQAPGGGPGMVWVNASTKVYHCSGDRWYGRTKDGQYMPESAAKAQGAHGVRGKSCS